MKVLLFSRYGRLGSSSRLRYYQFIPRLQELGIEITIASFLPDTYIQRLYSGQKVQKSQVGRAYLGRLRALARAGEFDLVWMEKELLPWLPAWGERILGSKVPWIVDYDDAVFHEYDLNPRRAIRSLLGDKIDNVMRLADAVTVGNGYLEERAQAAGARRIERLPTVVDTGRYQISPSGRVEGSLTIGWVGTPVTASCLAPVREALAEVSSRSNVQVVLVGLNENPLEGVNSIQRPWSEAGEVDEINRFDIGIMPLPDTPYHRGKCAYKLIQYMACGKPVVASPVGMNREIVVNGQNGYLATTTEEWVTALTKLLEDAAARQRMGEAARRIVESEYSVDAVVPRIASIFDEVVSARR